MIFGCGCIFAYKSIEIGDDVFIGQRAIFLAEKSLIKIGNKIMFGPDVKIMGGDHRMDVIGKFMFDVKDKRREDDLDILIEDDVWIGTGVTILKGVTVGRGSVIGAGSVLVKSIPPYSIAVGNPARVIKERFNKTQIIKHEMMIYHK